MAKLRHLFGSTKRALGLQTMDWLFLIPGLGLYMTITMWTIAGSSIWFDEAFGAYMIRFNFWDIARYTANDVHPPLYYWLLKLWSMLFGTGELALRSMSVLFGAVAIIFGYLLVKRLFSSGAARLSLLFMVLSPMLVRYGQEARMYTLVAAIALAATYVLTFAISSKKKLPWVIYGVLVSLGMWVHYFSAIVWVAHWVWRADVVRRVAAKGQFIKRFFSPEWILAHVVAVGLFVPWLPFLAVQVFKVQAFGFWIPPVTPDTMINFMTNVAYYQNVYLVTGWLAMIFGVMFIGLFALAYHTYKRMGEGQRQSYRLIASIAFAPILLLFVMSMPPLRSSFIDRYLIASAVGIAIFAGVTMAYGSKYIGSKLRFMVPVILALMMVIGVANVWHYGNYNKITNTSNNTRQIMQAIVAKSSDSQPIIAATPWLFYEAVYYASAQHPVYFIDPGYYQFGSLDMLKYNDQFKIKDVSAFEKAHPIVWYVFYSPDSKPDAPQPDWQALQTVTVSDSFSGQPVYQAIEYQIRK